MIQDALHRHRGANTFRKVQASPRELTVESSKDMYGKVKYSISLKSSVRSKFCMAIK